MKPKIVYENIGRYGGILRFSIVPKKLRHKGVDRIKVQWCSDIEAKEGWINSVEMKNWEALLWIKGLTQALINKKGDLE